MRSRAHFKTHPIHPMLIPFPIAFFLGTFVFDVLGSLLGLGILRIVGYYMNISGIVTALLAAVPGVIDYLHSVPPDSSAKTRGLKHGIVNVGATVLFLVVFILRNLAEPNFTIIILIQVVALGLLTAGGWMGGTLVYRNGIGVFPRYASSGKWQEQHFKVDEDTKKLDVGKTDDLQTDQLKLLHINDKRVVLGRTETGYVAFSDHCTHKGGSLASGVLICGTVQCPWHGSQFDVKTGTVRAGPANDPIKPYTVEVTGNRILLNVEEIIERPEEIPAEKGGDGKGV
jgi:nitrite reductase/ring-hydroxylating ferredoxin subunit/uncharacterized membrane protein